MSKTPEIKLMQACKELDRLINRQAHLTGTPEILEIQSTFWRFVEDLRQRDLAYAQSTQQANDYEKLKSEIKSRFVGPIPDAIIEMIDKHNLKP
jgi:hypothetical protein